MSEPLRHKLVWFVPREALEATREAVFAAGAGRIGDYERCSWYTAGTGTFLAGEGVTDFDHYRVDPTQPLFSDFFVPDDAQPPKGVSLAPCQRAAD